MEQNKLQELKDSPRVVTYLQMMESVITRMANNSSACKLLVATFVAVLSFSNSISWILGIVVIIYGFLADSYYLALEKVYREKYNKFLTDVNNNNVDELKIYELCPKNSDYEGEMFFKVIRSMKSCSVWSYYLTLMIFVIFKQFYI